MNKTHSFTAAFMASMLALPVSQAVQAQAVQVQVSGGCGTTTCHLGFRRDDGMDFGTGTMFFRETAAPLFSSQFQIIPSSSESTTDTGAGLGPLTALFTSTPRFVPSSGDTRQGEREVTIPSINGVASVNLRLTIDTDITAIGMVTLSVSSGDGYTLTGLNDDGEFVFARETAMGDVGVFMPVADPVVDTAEVMRLQGELDAAEVSLAAAPTQAEVDAANANVVRLMAELAAAQQGSGGETVTVTLTAEGMPVVTETETATTPTRRSSSNSGSGDAVAALVLVGGFALAKRFNWQTGYAPLDAVADKLSLFAAPTGRHKFGIFADYRHSDTFSIHYSRLQSGLDVEGEVDTPDIHTTDSMTFRWSF